MAKLAAYLAKRDFDKTAEPTGTASEPGGSSFVIQKHDATRLHYDLRLELDGVMLSWAVTRGPSLVPGEKRLAVHVEDHPVEYNVFEGTIPKGQYGGGTVLIWDRGRWEPEHDPHEGMKKGHLDFRLDGEKLHGRFHLVRLKPRARERQESWLLIKSEDEFARHEGDPDILEESPLSVSTGRTLAEIASDKAGAVWQSNRGEPAEPGEPSTEKVSGSPRRKAPADTSPDELAGAASPRKPDGGARSVRKTVSKSQNGPNGSTPASRQEADPNGLPSPDPEKLAEGGVRAKMPSAIEPCLATLASEVPKGSAWIHEIKWDGYRLVAFKTGAAVRLATRRGHDWTTRFPSVAEAIGRLPIETAILDGEAVIEDANGVPSFSALQNALSDEHGRVARDAVFHAFDLLYLDGSDLRSLPLEDRKARLAALIPPATSGFLRLSEHIDGDGGAMVRSACGLGLEGVISKRRDRPYRSGRGDDWVKIKCTERQEFVVVGYVPSSVSARAVGSLVLGYYEDGKLTPAGRCGTGFTAETARSVWRKLDSLRRKTSPFPERLSAEERRNVVWAEPTLVAEVEFRGWTADARLRHAAFKGLREDKAASEVVRERPAGGTTGAGTRWKKAAADRPRQAGEVAGVPLTNPDRVLWSEGTTKQDLAEFYDGISGWLLPHIAGRPLSLVRCPNGAEKGCFFQKHSWAGLGENIHRETVRDEDGEEEVLYVETIAGVVSLVQAGVLEIHAWGSTMADVDRPNRIVMDLDPADDVPWASVAVAARDVRDRLKGVGLESFLKTTGGKGLHVVVPLTPAAGWVEVKSFAKTLADAMESDDPARYVAKASKQARRGRIYVDYLRNGRGATAIAAYSTRARPGVPVSVPIGWDELTGDLKPNGYTVHNLAARLESATDPWAEIFQVDQKLPSIGRARKRKR